jgi:hypothetical protein
MVGSTWPPAHQKLAKFIKAEILCDKLLLHSQEISSGPSYRVKWGKTYDEYVIIHPARLARKVIVFQPNAGIYLAIIFDCDVPALKKDGYDVPLSK